MILFLVVASLVNYFLIKLIVKPSTTFGNAVPILVSIVLAVLTLYVLVLVGMWSQGQ